jgi:serine/threonine-protein kinase HipA
MKRPAGREPAHVEQLEVRLDLAGRSVTVGTLAWSRDERRAYFEYAREFLDAPLELSPFNLAAAPGVKAGPYHPFSGLHGLFNDSLPDGWGRLLLDRRLEKQKLDFHGLSPLDRLAYVGTTGMGALRYIPEAALGRDGESDVDLDWLADQTDQVQREVPTANVDRLQQMQGGSAGARPKIMLGFAPDRGLVVPDFGHGLPEGYEHWMVKFRARNDSEEAGSEEYAYSLMAGAAGVEMPTTRLITTQRGRYFAVRRFDRVGASGIHVHTASGLLEADHRMPQIDYDMLLRVTRVLTRDERHVRQMFRRMAFNALARNRDDHSKNHAFLMDANGAWHPTPAYDLTLSDGPAGEHSLAIAGEGRNPNRKHIMAVAKAASIPAKEADAIFEQVLAATATWPDHAGHATLSDRRMSEIDAVLKQQAHT